ncbi:MAG: diguanylate cyclase [Geobacteraceae bacterium GWB2_52_12]|nr:MAG: diguanylate cyclase [Geobacteraceae bacterium GWB2_52_12]
MTNKGRANRKDATGQPPEGIPPASEEAVITREEDADQRTLAASLRQDAADLRKEATELRHDTADQRENIADQRENIADLRQEAADLRQDVADQLQIIADQREETADLRQGAADLREETADLRQGAADQREKVQRTEKRATKSKILDSVRAAANIRDANEFLISATIHALKMTEVAERATNQMAYMAEHDFLTGLPNRALLTDRLAQSIELAKRHRNKVALMYLDLDHFKHINDSLGHAVGDQLLQSVAKRLQACVRLSDTVSRQGGDEFVVLLAEVEEAQDAALTANKLIKAVSRPYLIDGHRLHVTLSIGISIYPDDGTDIEVVFRNADTAMYHAKKCGRNNYQAFTPDMNTRAVARQSVEAALHHALEQHEFVLHYQPKVNLKTGAITGAEALLRWQRYKRRLVSPAQFVSIAEECGLILPIGKWVLREACRQTQIWLQSGLNLPQIAVNVSSIEFHGRDFLAGVRTILDETGLDPHRLEFELTESGVMQDTQQTSEILHELKDLGVKIAIDDFGTGYSSLSYLCRFPIDVLKIDQSFVQAIKGNGGGEAGEAIVGAIIAMGKSLKQRVVAEGIETRKQFTFLQSHRCTEGQGYYFGRPVAARKFAKLLVRSNT